MKNKKIKLSALSVKSFETGIKAEANRFILGGNDARTHPGSHTTLATTDDGN